MSKNCISVHLSAELLEILNEQKIKTGLSQNRLIINLIEKGLDQTPKEKKPDQIYYFVKVRIDTSKMLEFGQKLQTGRIDTSHTLMTFCIQDDPTVGLNFWRVENHDEFERIFSQYKPFYDEIIEIIRVVTPMKAMSLIIEEMKSK
jgi:hypothetical protein